MQGIFFVGRAFSITKELRKVEGCRMRDDRDEHDELIAAGAIYPVPDCRALVSYCRPRGARQSRASTACTEPRENACLEGDVVSSLAHSSVWQYAVICVRSEKGCERLHIPTRKACAIF